MGPNDSAIILLLFLSLCVMIAPIVGLWKIFIKAKKPEWAAIIPIYNLYIFTEIIKKPWWWVILFLVPYINIIFIIWGLNLLSKIFGKSDSFAVGLILLTPVFLCILGFDDSVYHGQSKPERNNSGYRDWTKGPNDPVFAYQKNREQRSFNQVSFENESKFVNGSDVERCFKLGISKKNIGDNYGAILEFSKVINANPQLEKAYLAMASVKKGINDLGGAIDDYSKALEINPYNSISYNNRGNIRKHLGHFNGAIEDYRRAIELNPDFETAKRNLAIVLNLKNKKV